MFRLKQSLKVIVSDKVLDALLLGVVGFIVYEIVAHTFFSLTVEGATGRALDIPVMFMMQYAYFYLIVMLYTGYESFAKIRANYFREIAESAAPNGCYGSLLSALMTVNCGGFVMIASAVMLCVMQYENCSAQYLWQCFLLCFVRIFLAGIIGILLGAAIARINKKWLGIFLLVLAVFVTSSPVLQMFHRFENDTVRLVCELFGIFPVYHDNLPMTSLVGYPVNAHTWGMVFLWLGVLTAMIGILYFRRAKVCTPIAGTAGVLIALVSGFVYAGPYSNIDYVYEAPYFYYEKKGNYVSGNFEKADFAITSYEMDIKIRTKIYMSCTMNVDNSSLKEYAFTLYHTLKVSGVYNQNHEKLEFTQEGDYITVRNNTGYLADKITIEYAGCVDAFYADTGAFCLYSTNPYYPRAGKSNLYTGRRIAACSSEGPVPFTLKCDSTCQWYTNLEKIQDGLYQGEANGLVLIGGFIEEQTIGGTTVYYPYLSRTDYSEEKLKDWLDDLKAVTDYDFYGKKIFITEIPPLGGDKYCNINADCIEAVNLGNIKSKFLSE